jgi:beta-galactosidase/beta-glucuronidase
LPAKKAVDGTWKVAFDPDWGGPAETEFKQLISWPEHPDKGIRYYSGTAVYRNVATLSEADLQYRITLDLGELYNLAEVNINGAPAGVWWKQPFSGDITGLLQKGENTIEIKVVNLWPNRLIGDQFLPENQRFTKTNVMKFSKETPLLPSGLLGPVTLSFGELKTICL